MELRNRHLCARFDPATGALLHLSHATDNAPNLVTGSSCGYQENTGKIWVGQDYAGQPQAPWEIRAVHHDTACVSTELRSADVDVRIAWSLPADSPLLACAVRVKGRGGAGRLGYTMLPRIAFAGDFNDAFYDEPDLYDDGAELAPGQERPCWRVFYRTGRADGLLLATRSKTDMSHMSILARAFDVEPHIGMAYTSDPVGTRPALDCARRRAHEVNFELGPWTATGHRRLLKTARLDQPHAVKHAPPRGRPMPQARLKGKVFHATRLAGDSATTTFDPKRWMRARAPWAQSGSLLFATTGVAAPDLTLDPQLKGVYHVFLGVGDSRGATLHVTGDPEKRYRVVSAAHSQSEAFRLMLAGAHRPRELDFGFIQMDGKQVRIGRHPDHSAPSTIDYIRFEKLSPAQQKRWERQRDADPVLPLSGLADICDISVLLDTQKPDPRAFAAVIWEHANSKLRKCYWRIDGQCSDFPCSTNTMRYPASKVHGVFVPHSRAYGRALLKTDVLRLAVKAAKKYGVELYGWMRFNNYTGNVQSEFFTNHPQYWEESESGHRGRKLCLAHPEVRQHKIDILVEAAKYGLAGLNLGFLRHPPILHYAPILVEGYQKQFGRLPPREPKHPDPAHVKTRPQRDPQAEYENFWRYRAGFMTLFGQELRQALRAANLSHVRIAIWVRPNHCLFDGIDLPAWLDQGLCDEVVTMHYSSGVQDLELNWETPQWREQVRAKVPLIRTLEPWRKMSKVKAQLRRILAEGYDGICTYESNDTVLDTDFIQLYRSLCR